jgi:hypothetical protein
MYFIVNIGSTQSNTEKALKFINSFQTNTSNITSLFQKKLNDNLTLLNPESFNVKNSVFNTVGKFKKDGSQVMININHLDSKGQKQAKESENVISANIQITFSGDRNILFSDKVFASVLALIVSNIKAHILIEYVYTINNENQDLEFWQQQSNDSLDDILNKLNSII